MTLSPVLSTADRAAYDALQSHVACLPGSCHLIRVEGDKAGEALNGLISNDVLALVDGEGCYAAALTAKGKVLSDLVVLRVDSGSYLLLLPIAGAPLWLAMARKYVNPRLAKITDDGLVTAAVLLAGPEAAATVARVTGAWSADEVSAWPVWHHAPAQIAERPVRIVRTAYLGARASYLMLGAEGAEGPEVTVGSSAVWEVARIEAGRPAVAVDMTEETLTQEANLDVLGAISFTKGCYTGQETVARVHFRGHVNRHLRGLRTATAVPPTAPLVDGGGKVVGDVRSTGISPHFGPIALAMVRREVEPGAPLWVQTDAGLVLAEVVTLPFVGAPSGVLEGR